MLHISLDKSSTFAVYFNRLLTIMKIKPTSRKTRLPTLDNANRTCEMTEPLSGRQQVMLG